MPSASLEHSVEVKVPKEVAWKFWTEVSNWVLDSGVEAVELDGPFAPGTRGVTTTGDQKTVWEIAEVEPGERALLTMGAGGVDVDIEWTFSALGDQDTLMTQRMILRGSKPDEAASMFRKTIRKGMAKLAQAIQDAAK